MSFRNSFVFWIHTLHQVCLLQYFLPDSSLSFHSLISIFCRAEVFKFNKVPLINVFLSWTVLWGLYLKTHCQTQGHLDFSPVLSSRNFMVLSFPFRSVIHFEINFVKDEISISRFYFFFACWYPLFQHHLCCVSISIHFSTNRYYSNAFKLFYLFKAIK